MATKKQPVELSRAGLKRVLEKTAVAVRADNLGRGIPMTVVEGSQLVEVHPDGTRRIIQEQMPLDIRVTRRRFTLK